MIRAILATDDNWGIGKDGGLPWPHNPADLKWFKENTVGGVVVMGKATWDSLPNKPLPNRNNVVVTSSNQDKDKGSYHFVKFENATEYLTSMNKLQNVWIIGGAKLIEGLLPIIDEIWLSRIKGDYNCDTFLPQSIITELFSFTDSGNDKDFDVYVDKYTKR